MTYTKSRSLLSFTVGQSTVFWSCDTRIPSGAVVWAEATKGIAVNKKRAAANQLERVFLMFIV